MKKLIINADDFGMNKEVNDGIKLGIKRGVVTSVSVMANMLYFEDAIQFLKKYPRVSVGLHFNITEGKPLIRHADSLTGKDNNFFFWTQLINKLVLKQVEAKIIEKELAAQFKKLAASGLPITHLDSHHHIHLYPPLFRRVSEFAYRKKIAFVRGKSFNIWNLTLKNRLMPQPTQIVVNMLLLLNSVFNKQINCLSENNFYDLNWGKRLTPETFIKVLDELPKDMTLLICHLAVEKETDKTSFFALRYKALELLSHPLVKEYLANKNTLLSPYRYD